MTNKHVERPSVRGRLLPSIALLVLLTALGVTLAQRPARALEAGGPALIAGWKEPLTAVSDANNDRGPGEDEAALAKLPEP